MTSHTLTLKEKKAIGKEKKRGKQENDKTNNERKQKYSLICGQIQAIR